MKSKITSEIEKSIEIKKALLKDDNLLSKIQILATRCIQALDKGAKIIFYGNGGSFADAQHLSAEFTSRFMFDRPALASIALGTNSSAMSAIGNDYGYDKIFSREIESIAKSEDILIAITTSGNSKNVLNAIDCAKNMGLETFIFTGKSGGKVSISEYTINVPSEDTARIQECHILIGHILCGIVEDNIFSNLKK